MDWIELASEAQLETLLEKSRERVQVVFKHSTRCSISRTVWSRMERADQLSADADFYYLDLVAHRAISDKLASVLDVQHESPQVLVIKEGKIQYDADHFAITAEDLDENLG